MAIPKKYACSDEEKKFVHSHLAGLNMTEAWRRAFPDDIDEWEGKKGKKMLNKEMSRRARYLLDQDYIQGYIAELEGSAPGDLARATLTELASLKGDRQAAEKILEQEDKLNFQTGQERWAEIMCAIGTEVVVPLPGGGEVVFPLGSIFPQFADSQPPPDAVEKTIKSLDQFLWADQHPDRDNINLQDWTYGDGLKRRYPSGDSG